MFIKWLRDCCRSLQLHHYRISENNMVVHELLILNPCYKEIFCMRMSTSVLFVKTPFTENRFHSYEDSEITIVLHLISRQGNV